MYQYRDEVIETKEELNGIKTSLLRSDATTGRFCNARADPSGFWLFSINQNMPPFEHYVQHYFWWSTKLPKPELPTFIPMDTNCGGRTFRSTFASLCMSGQAYLNKRRWNTYRTPPKNKLQRNWLPVSRNLATTTIKLSNVFKVWRSLSDPPDPCPLHCWGNFLERWYRQGDPCPIWSCRPTP